MWNLMKVIGINFFRPLEFHHLKTPDEIIAWHQLLKQRAVFSEINIIEASAHAVKLATFIIHMCNGQSMFGINHNS